MLLHANEPRGTPWLRGTGYPAPLGSPQTPVVLLQQGMLQPNRATPLPMQEEEEKEEEKGHVQPKHTQAKELSQHADERTTRTLTAQQGFHSSVSSPMAQEKFWRSKSWLLQSPGCNAALPHTWHLAFPLYALNLYIFRILFPLCVGLSEKTLAHTEWNPSLGCPHHQLLLFSSSLALPMNSQICIAAAQTRNLGPNYPLRQPSTAFSAKCLALTY